MRFTVPFLLAIAVYVATVLGANQTSFNPNEDMLYDVVSASDAIAFRLERALGVGENVALMLGALLLTIPALLTFHLFRVGFGGSVQSLIQDAKMSRQLALEKERATAARYATAASVASRPEQVEVLTRARAGDQARNGSGASTRDGAKAKDRERRSGFGANIAAALSGRGSASSTSVDANATAGTTSLSASSQAAPQSSARSSGGLKDKWGGILDKTPDFSRLKTGAQGLRERMTARSGTTKMSLDDIADGNGNKPDGS